MELVADATDACQQLFLLTGFAQMFYFHRLSHLDDN